MRGFLKSKVEGVGEAGDQVTDYYREFSSSGGSLKWADVERFQALRGEGTIVDSLPKPVTAKEVRADGV